MQGASPLASPGLGGTRHGLNLRSRHPAGGVPPALAARPAVAVPDGGLPGGVPAYPAVSLLPCPHPPARARRALFPGGKGETLGYFMQGASPLASPGLDGARHGLNLRSRHPAGASPRRWRLDQPLRCPTGACQAGCLLTLPLVYFVSPIPPTPFPGGKGETFSLFRRGLRPRHPGTYLLTALTDHAEQVSCAREPAVQRSGREINCLKNVPPGFSSGDARGEAPGKINFGLPPSRWEGGQGGWGQNSKLTERQAGDKQGNSPQGFLYGRSAGVKEVNAAGVKFMPPDVAKKPRMWYTECGKPAPIYAREKEP